MNDAAANDSRAARKPLLRALTFYFCLWLAACALTYNVFGDTAAIGLSLILIFPLIVGMRMYRNPSSPRSREYAFLFALIASALLAGGALVWSWHDAGIARMHRDDVECGTFERLLRSDPAFRNIEIFVSGKHIFWIRGAVASKEDLKRLRSLMARFSIDWGEDIEVTGVLQSATPAEQGGRRNSQ